MFCLYGEKKMAQTQQVLDWGEKAVVGPRPSRIHVVPESRDFTTTPSPSSQRGLLMREWWLGGAGGDVVGWVCFKHVANVWLELCLNPHCHRGTAWESLVNVQREGERVFTSLACSYMLRCWMKRCLNMERTWGFWLHQRHPRYFDFVFPSFGGWWVHPAAAVATAANNQSEVKWLLKLEKAFVTQTKG